MGAVKCASLPAESCTMAGRTGARCMGNEWCLQGGTG